MDTKNKEIKVNGMIIKENLSKEYDKSLIILTKELGKIQVYAFGCRNEKSKNISKTRIFTYAKFELKIIKNRYILNSADVFEYFDDITKNIDNMSVGSYFLELINYFSCENIEYNGILNLTYYALKALIADKMDKNLIKYVFQLKCLQYEGIYIDENMLPVNSSKILKFVWQYILNNEGIKLFSFALDKDIQNELKSLIDSEYKMKVNKKFKSLSD